MQLDTGTVIISKCFGQPNQAMDELLGGGPGLKMHRVLGGAIGGKLTGGPGLEGT